MEEKAHDKKHLKKLKKQLKKCRVSPLEELEPPKIAWGRYNKDKSKFISLGTLDNFSLITGKAKSKKSFFINIITAAAASDIPHYQFENRLPKDKKEILYFDTEQAKYHVQLAVKRICKQINNKDPQHLHVYGLRSLNPTERFELIKYIIYKNDNIGFVIIDGIKDLINSINNEEEATKIASELLKWTEERHIHIVCVLHQNKADNNARGHLGSELTHKAETVLSVTKDSNNKGISIVEPVMCRNEEPDDFAFEIVNGLPVIIDDYEIRPKKSKSIGLLNIPDEEKFLFLNEIYSKKDEYFLTDLTNSLQSLIKVKKPNVPSGNNAMRKLISYMKDKNWLIQVAPKKPYTIGIYKN